MSMSHVAAEKEGERYLVGGAPAAPMKAALDYILRGESYENENEMYMAWRESMPQRGVGGTGKWMAKCLYFEVCNNSRDPLI